MNFLTTSETNRYLCFDLNTIVEQYKKRKRDRTFSYIERSNLVNIIEQHFAVIECKKTDALSCRAKSAEWDKITDEFNAMTPRHISRDKSTLKNCWENLKKRARAVLNESRSNSEADAFIEKELKEDPLMVKVLSLIKTKCEGFFNIHDFDAPMFEIVSLTNENFGEESAENIECDFEATQVICNGEWSYCTPVLLRTPESQTSSEKCSEKVKNGNTNKESRQLLESSKNEEIKFKLNEPSCVKTLNRPLTSMKHGAAHSRPIFKGNRAAALSQNRINTFKLSYNQMKEKHELSMHILLLQEHQEIEKLKQEKEKNQQEKMNTLKIINNQTKEKHELLKNVLLLQEQQEAEKLQQEKEKTEQEKIKTEILRLELENKKQSSFKA